MECAILKCVHLSFSRSIILIPICVEIFLSKIEGKATWFFLVVFEG